MNKATKKFFLFAVPIVILSAVLMQYKTRKQANRNFIHFNEASINGIITSIRPGGGSTHIVVDDSLSYSFIGGNFPDVNQDGFRDLADKGDRVIKKSLSDTLKLVKSDTTYLYTFLKITD